MPERGRRIRGRTDIDHHRRHGARTEAGTASPVPAMGNNLATFLGARLAGSFDNLNCKNYGLTNPVTVTTDVTLQLQSSRHAPG